MSSIRILKSGKPQVRWRASDGSEPTRTFPDTKAGHRAAERFRAEVDIIRRRGEDVPEDATPRVAPPTLRRAFETYQAHCQDVAHVADSTGHQIVTALNLFHDEYLGERLGILEPGLEHLTIDNIEGFFVWMHRERRWQGRVGMTAWTSKKRAVVVHEAWARIHRAHPLHTPMPVAHDLPKRTPILLEPRRHTWEECDRVIARATIEWHRRLMIVCRYTSLRVKHQALRLLGTDFDIRNPDNATMLVRYGKSGAEQAGRRVPISPHFARELATWGLDAGYLIKMGTPTSKGKRSIPYKYFSRYWREATGEDVRQPFHGFRKAFEQEMERLDVAPNARDLLVGHKIGTSRGSRTDRTYLGDDPMMPKARAAVRLIPAIGQARDPDGAVSIIPALRGAT